MNPYHCELELGSVCNATCTTVAKVRETSRKQRESDQVTLNHLAVNVDATLFPDTLKMKVTIDFYSTLALCELKK